MLLFQIIVESLSILNISRHCWSNIGQVTGLGSNLEQGCTFLVTPTCQAILDIAALWNNLPTDLGQLGLPYSRFRQSQNTFLFR